MLTLGLLCSVYLFNGCSVPNRGLFTKRTPHEAYENKITETGLQNTALGIDWIHAAQKVLQHPIKIQLPYKETGFFAAEQPNAAGYIFVVRKGEKLNIAIEINPAFSFLLFADLWSYHNGSPQLLLSADTIHYTITYEVEKNDSCIFRIQPELLRSGGYTITIITSPSLAFPVPSEDHPKIGSFWGDERDAGARKHEGIDIFGKFRTPVVAAADGYITGVREGGLGGKVVFLRPYGKDYSLYYAHLDSQIAKEGQQVKTGDVVGLMGNTGNAKYTLTHLHFGIYTNSGAVDPLPFVEKTNKQPRELTALLQALNEYVHNNKTTEVSAAPNDNKTTVEKIIAGTPLHIIAATGSLYKVQLPDEREAFINSNIISYATPVKTITTDSAAILLTGATANAAGKKTNCERK
jgi:hypothetical protein